MGSARSQMAALERLQASACHLKALHCTRGFEALTCIGGKSRLKLAGFLIYREEVILEYMGVYDWGCGANRNVTASRITYTPPTLFVERYEAPCKGAVKRGHVPALSDFKRVPQGGE